ncbi:MAG: transcription antitermination factor NusB [Patescibacteria group bacterium]
MISRRQTREYLLQSLYARVHLSPFDRDIFYSTFFSGGNTVELDTAYLTAMEDLIIANERKLIDITALLAPKFEIDTLPVLHILILMISLTELVYWTGEAIPESVSVNEAIELAKRFSDDQGKGFINGALSTFLKDRDKAMLEAKEGAFKIFG